MKKTLSTFMALVVPMSVVLMAGSAMASNTDNQTVNVTVSAIDELAISDAVTLTFNAANIEALGSGATDAYVIGNDDFQVTDATSTYSVTTNSATEKKITGYLDAAITTVGMKLYVTLASASGATENEVDLTSVVTASPADLVTGLLQEADADQLITYRVSATVATPVASYAPQVTLTLTDA